MTDEIIKLYENAEIKKVKDYYCPNCETKLEDWFGRHKEYICPNERCDYALCDDEEDFQECLEHLSYREEYPPFTAEKQLQLENFLLEDLEDKTFTQFEMLKTIENKFLYVYRFSKNNSNLKRFDTIGETRQECLAGLINSLWQDLTEEEKQQVKGILE